MMRMRASFKALAGNKCISSCISSRISSCISSRIESRNLFMHLIMYLAAHLITHRIIHLITHCIMHLITHLMTPHLRVSPPDPRPEGRESRLFFHFLGSRLPRRKRGKRVRGSGAWFGSSHRIFDPRQNAICFCFCSAAGRSCSCGVKE